TITSTRTGFLVRFHGACDMAISTDLTTVVCRLDGDTDPALGSVLFLGTTMAFLLTEAGRLTLHGSAVRTDGGALGFVGDSGVGKSTVAALCCAAGASLITDDVMALDVRDGDVSCLGGWPELRVRVQSRSALEPLLPGRF